VSEKKEATWSRCNHILMRYVETTPPGTPAHKQEHRKVVEECRRLANPHPGEKHITKDGTEWS